MKLKPILLAMLLTGCEAKVQISSTPIVPTNAAVVAPVITNMPPDWTLVCDNQGHYAAKYYNGALLVRWAGGDLFTDRQQVIDKAWGIYQAHTNRVSEVKPDISWNDTKYQECEK